MISIRGATTVDRDEPELIIENTKLLLQSIIAANSLQIDLIIAIFFTCTQDLQSAYPAKGARDMGITHASLMCLQEMYVPGSLPKCIRICVFYNQEGNQTDVKHVYLNDAVVLRQDLFNK